MEQNELSPRSVGRSSESVQQGFRHFWDAMALRLVPVDGLLTARIVGEFSAGKTRLLKELISGSVPAELLPISSLEPQTRLQLEITYGSSSALTLIERSEDSVVDSTALQRFQAFPTRQELECFDPMRHRLRLTVPDERFVLPDGDGSLSDGNVPTRLFLIDTPGWNSGDDLLAEQQAATLIAGDYNLALVYVTSLVRLDSAVNTGRLQDFLIALTDAIFYGDHASLVVVVTRCPRAEAGRACERVAARIRDTWKSMDMGNEDLDLAILAIDFDEAKPAELDAFRTDFWDSLFAPIHLEGEPAQKCKTVSDWHANALSYECQAWPISAAIEAAHAQLVSARMIIGRALKEDSFLFGMNRHKLRRRLPAEVHKVLRDQWHRQLGGDPRLAHLTSEGLPRFDDEHPLALWWQIYWVRELDSLLQAVRVFLEQMECSIEMIDADTLDVQSVIENGVREAYQVAQRKVWGSFALLLDAVATATTIPPIDRQVATLLALSALESHYSDCRDEAVEDLRRSRS